MRTCSVTLTALMLATAPALAQTTPATLPAQTMPAQTTPAAPPTVPIRPVTTMPMGKVAVNTAAEAQLAAIPGVGAKLAVAIVKARPFKNSADLIKGIGPENYVKLGLNKVFTY